MPLDPSIALQAKGVALPDPMALAGNAMQLQAGQQALQSNALSFQQAQQSAAETNALRMRVSAPDFATLAPEQQIGEMQKVAPIASQPIIKGMIDQRKTMVETGNAVQTNAAAQAKDIAQTVASAQTPQDLIQAGYMGAAQGRWDKAKFDAVVAHLLTGKMNTPEAFAAFKDQLGKAIMSPDALAAQGQPDVKMLESGGMQVPYNTKPSAGPVGPIAGGTALPSNPTVIRGEQGEVLSVAPGGKGYSQIPFAPPGGLQPSAEAQAPRDASTQSAMNEIDRQSRDVHALEKGLANAKTPEEKAAYASALAKAKTTSAGAYPTSIPPDMLVTTGRAPGTKDFHAAGDATNAAKYEADLNETVATNRQSMAYNDKFQEAMRNYQTGPGAETRLAVAKALAAVGVSPAIVEKVNRGTIADAQEIQKLAGTSALTALKSAMDGQGKIAQAEFRVFLSNNPNIELDPNAIQKMHEFQAQQFQRVYAEQQALADYRQKGGDPARWPAVWSKMLDTSGLAKPAMATDARGTPGGVMADPKPQAAILETRIAPDGRRVAKFADGTIGYVK